MFDVRLSGKSEKFFRKSEEKLQLRLKMLFETLEQSSVPATEYDIKKIGSGEFDTYRVRLSSYRVIYAVHWKDKIIRVIKIERKKDRTYKF